MDLNLELWGKKSIELVFWASNIHYMNDPNELSFLYDELVKALPELENDLEINERYKRSNQYC